MDDFEFNEHFTTSYVSRVCDVPTLVAEAGLRELVRRTPVIAAPEWTLRFGEPTATTIGGVLTAGWARRASVVVEIETWSRHRVLVGLRHRARAVPWWSVQYFQVAHEAIVLIGDALADWADEPLRIVSAPEIGLARR